MLSETRFRDFLDRQHLSGLSVKDFCFNEGISKSSFYYWRRKLQKQESPKNFIPLVINSSRSANRPYEKRETQPSQISGPLSEESLCMELVFPNGIKLRLRSDLDLSTLKSLICLYP